MKAIDTQRSVPLSIAGLNFEIDAPGAVVPGEFPSVYESFLNSTITGYGSVHIPVVLEMNNIPEIGRMRKVFDTGQSWSMFMDGRDYLIVLDPPLLEKRVVWAARFGADFRRITIYCSDTFIREGRGVKEVVSPFRYPLDQILLMFFLARRAGAIFHGAGMVFKGKGYMFLGRSGAGKSTLSHLLLKRKDMEVLSDDRMIARKIGKAFHVYGTPWPGDAGIAVNKGVDLSGILFIVHGGENRIEKISASSALERLLPTTSVPWFDKDIVSEILLFCEDMVSNIPAYKFDFIPDDGVVNALEEFLSAQ